MKIIARIHTAFKEKFGIPRQSGITDGVAKIIFEPEYPAIVRTFAKSQYVLGPFELRLEWIDRARRVCA